MPPAQEDHQAHQQHHSRDPDGEHADAEEIELRVGSRHVQRIGLDLGGGQAAGQVAGIGGKGEQIQQIRTVAEGGIIQVKLKPIFEALRIIKHVSANFEAENVRCKKTDGLISLDRWCDYFGQN